MIAEVVTVLKKKKIPLDNIKEAFKIIVDEIQIIDDHQYHCSGLKECLSNPTTGYSYWDALYAVLILDLKIKEIISFDTDFDCIKGINRVY